MKLSGVALIFALLFVGAAAADESDAANPLSAVIGMCKDLEAKVTADGEAEAKAYGEYFEWCDDVAKEKQFEIKTSTSQKEKLEARIEELAASIEEADSTISTLAEKISTNSADLDAATKVRDKESAEFAANEKELIEVVDTLGRAIGVLEKELGSAAFAQVSKSQGLKNVLSALSTVIEAASFSTTDKTRLVALVQARQNAEDEDEDEETSAPAADAYESKSGGILDVLGDMQEKAEGQLAELRKVEVAAKQNYDMLKQGLSDQLANDNKDMAASKSGKAKSEEGKATAEGDLSITKADLKNAQATLASTQKNCLQVAADHEGSIASRGEELKVIAEAIKILEEVAAGGAAASSFLQTSQGKKPGMQSHVPMMVKALARKHHSAALAQLSARISSVVRSFTATSDPFGKIKGLIEDMIAKLENEAKDSATEKAYCDAEMKKTAKSKGDLEADIEKMSTSIDQAAARSAELKEEVKTLQAELAKMADEQSKAEKVRSEDHEVYVTQKADLETALAGIRKALDVLREYYAKGDGAALLQDNAKFAAFMQQPSPPVGHSKSGGAGGSIISILEVAESDTATNLAKVETAEADEAAAYDKALQEFKLAKAEKDADVKYKTQEFMGLDKSITEISSDRDNTGSELAAVDEYWAKIQDRCVAKPEPYEERAKRREEEIAGLKEALTTLSSEAALVQKQRGGKQRHSSRHSMRGAAVLKPGA